MMKSVVLGLILELAFGFMLSTAQAQTVDLPIDDGNTPTPPSVSAPTPVPRPISRRSDDCAVLKGALAVSAVMTTSFQSDGGFGVWKNIWQYNVDIGNAIASDFENRVVPLLKNPANRQQLQSIAQQIYSESSASSWGHGFNYWPNAYQQQNQKLQSAAESLRNLTQMACQ